MIERRKIFGRAFIVIGLAAVFYTVAMLVIGWDSLFEHLRQFDSRFIIPLLLLSSVNYVLRFWRWHLYLQRVDVPIPLRDSAILFLATFVMVVTPGKVGEVFKAIILDEKYRCRLAVGLPIILAERLFDFLGLFILAGAGLLFWRGSLVGMRSGLLIASALPVLLILFRSRRFHVWIIERAARKPQLSRIRPQIEDSVAALRTLLGTRLMAISLALSCCAWGAECFSLWLTCRAFATPIDLPDASFIYAAGTIIGSLFFLPGGIGGTEATIVWLLGDVGLSSTDATAAALVVRLATLWLAVLVGFLMLPAARRFFEADEKTIDEVSPGPDQPPATP